MWLPFYSQKTAYSLLLPQGTPLKYDTSTSSTSTKKHDVRSIIGSPGRTFPPVHPLDVMADTRALERACYEDSLKSRPGAASSTGGSITRGAPVIVPELGKPRQSPLAYEDHAAPFAGHLPRGSPVTTREPTPRLQEGAWHARGGARVRVGCLLRKQPTICSLLRLETRGSLTALTFHLPNLWVLPPNHTQHALHPQAVTIFLLASLSPSCPAIICSLNGSQKTFLKTSRQIVPHFCLNLSRDFPVHLE